MDKPFDVALLVFDGIQILDVSGPAAVFAAANDAIGHEHYRVHILSRCGGSIQSNSAIAIASQPVGSIAAEGVDTMLIVGGNHGGAASLLGAPEVVTWIRTCRQHARRFGSVCVGTYAIAELGLVDGYTVASHWSAVHDIHRQYPRVNVDANALYVVDRTVWTSAGVTAGIDMCLAMVTADLGDAVSGAIAKRLVLYAKRPGYQSQFSKVLIAQTAENSPFAELVNWMRENLTQPLDIGQLAARVTMSERNFQRKFTQSMSETPAHLVEGLRLELAQQLLETGMPVKQVAADAGFTNPAQLAKAFGRRIGMAPTLYRELHSAVKPVARRMV